MRSWKIRLLTYSIAAIAICGYGVVVPEVSCGEPILPEETADSMTVARSALPESSAQLWQKPTRAPYANSAVAMPGWQLDKSNADSGFGKPSSGTRAVSTTRTQGVSIRSEQTPTTQLSEGRPLPPCDADATACDPGETVTGSVGHKASEGNEKPVQASPPIDGTVVPVKWDAAPRSLQSVKVNRPGLAFQSEYCPFVLWNPSAPGEFLPDAIIDSARIGSCSELSIIKDPAGQVHLASVPRRVSTLSPKATDGIHLDHLAELQQLCPDAAPPQASDAGENYLSELNQLLQGESNWLFPKAGLLDLAPEEGNMAGDTYLDDLNELVKPQKTRPGSAGAVYRQTRARQETPVPPDYLVQPQQGSRTTYSSIAPEQNCLASAGNGIGVLFEPMARIQVTGLSTAPPSRGKDAGSEEPTELRRPENTSCAYLDNFSPAYYFVPQRYGACRPPRGVHEFYHQPLYFEDPNLERCGQSHGCLTTAVSAMYFGTAIAFTPYLTAATCPTSCEKSLPDCPTCHRFGHDAYWPGWSWKGAAAQTAAVTGLYFVVP